MSTYLSVNDFALELSVDEMTVRRLITSGFIEQVINATPFSKRLKLRIHRSELERVGKVLKLGQKRGRAA